MYGMVGKFITKAGKRGACAEILTRAAGIVGQFPGCSLYIVNEDLADENAIWVFEAWDDKESHDESLKDDRVRSLIAEAIPLMGGPPEGTRLNVIGGYGLAN